MLPRRSLSNAQENFMNTVQHLAFSCRDLKTTESFYTRHLGFRRVRTFNRGTPGEFCMLRLGSTCVELFQASPKDQGKTAADQPIGFKHLAFEVDDLDGVLAGLHAAGVQTDPIIDCSGIVPGFRICFFNDPDGNRLELMQGYQDEN
jgi:glyoxylase I family protein